jgi:two-component system CheB/CheR fusion protein
VNEELQTAKEEIQSANEELSTLNQELQDRNLELGQANDDLERALDTANAIVATVRGPLLILDGELRVEKANRAYYQTFHVLPEEIDGKLLWELGNGQWERPDLRAALENVLARDASFEDFEVEHELPEVGRRTLALNARRLLHEHDGKGRILLAIEDRTEAKRTAQQRELLLAEEHAARERAEAADQRKDELVATVSHELRGPLTTIGGWVHFLSEGRLDQETLAKALEAMGRGVKAQERLIADLLDQSRIAFGQIHLSRDPLDLVAIARAAMESVRAAAEVKGIQIHLAGDHTGSVVLGDADRMQQVIWNLLFNAIKFTPRRGRVQIDVVREGTHVRLTVRDTGVGIPADLLPHLFERFRAGRAPGHRQAGLGLGLTLVRELVELHEGTVRAESAGPGQGATFTIALPIAEAVPGEP